MPTTMGKRMAYIKKGNPYQEHSSWDEPNNKHQDYYRKKNERERTEKASGVKWNADNAYKDHFKDSGQYQRRSNPHRSANIEKEKEAFDAAEKLKKEATDTLNKSRMKRKESQEAVSNLDKAQGQDQACVIS